LPCNFLFRNLSNHSVLLKVTIKDKSFFNKLPNTVVLYNLPKKNSRLIGERRSTALVKWEDTSHFEVNIPPQTVIQLDDIGKPLVLGISQPAITIMVVKDTIYNGSIYAEPKKFKTCNKPFKKPSYYYDVQ
jgi:hypothetical protein